MRIASGLCVAGCYTVIEAWLQAKVTNETRGRAMGSYRLVDMGASLVAQLMIGVLEPASYVSYNLLAMFCCASLLPLTLTTASQPETPAAPAPAPDAGGCEIAAGGGWRRRRGPHHRRVPHGRPDLRRGVGLAADQIACFLAAFVLGGALAQYPTGWLADKYDRRWVLIWLSVAAMASCAITVAASGSGTLGRDAGGGVLRADDLSDLFGRGGPCA